VVPCEEGSDDGEICEDSDDGEGDDCLLAVDCELVGRM
jgi:hypothetical protein